MPQHVLDLVMTGDVEFLQSLGQLEGLADNHLQGGPGKVAGQLPPVDGDASGALVQSGPGYGCLSFPGAVKEILTHGPLHQGLDVQHFRLLRLVCKLTALGLHYWRLSKNKRF